MNLQNVRWPVLVLSFVVTLALLFGGGLMLRAQTVDQPLGAVLKAVPGVQSHRIELVGDHREVTVLLGETPDLEHTYTELNRSIGKVLNRAPYAVRLEDRRTPELEGILRRVNLHVQEALMTGKFADTADRVEREAAQAGAAARVSVDGDRFYLQLSKQGDYLYSVTERPKAWVQHPEEGGGMGL